MRKARFGDIEVKVEIHDPYGHREYHSFTEPKNHVEIHEDGKETILVISDQRRKKKDDYFYWRKRKRE